MPKKQIRYLAFGILLSLLIIATQWNVKATSQSNDRTQGIEKIALEEIEQVKTGDWGCSEFEIGELRQEKSWAFMNLICWPDEQTDPDVLVPDIVILAIAHHINGSWEVYLEGSNEFSMLIWQTPDSLVDPESKESLASMPSMVDELNHSQIIAGTYTTGLPWQPGDTWRYSQSLHGCALDLGTPQCGVSNSVYPAESGTVVWSQETCMLVRRSGSTLDIGYQHINSSDIANWGAGNWINSTDLIGQTTVSSGCSGSSTGHHVHFWMEDSAGCAANGSTMGGWTLNNPTFSKGSETRTPSTACSGANNWLYYEHPDPVPPTTSRSLSGSGGLNGWYLSNVQVTLTATDNAGGSGVKNIQYKIGDGAWQTHNGSSVIVSVTSEGSTTVYYKAEDNAGNIETQKSVVIKIDKADPLSACVLYGSGSNGWYSGDVTITCSGNDATSGLDHIDYDMDSGGSQEYSGSFVVSGEGNHDIVHTAIDVAGNVESDQTVAFGIDLTPPTVLTMTLNNGSTTSYNSTVIVSNGVSDNLSGVAEMCISYNQVAWDCAAYSSSFLYSLPAINQTDITVYFYVIDQAGNESSVASETITLDFYPDLPSSLNYRLCSTVVDSAGGSSGSTSFHVDSAVGQPSEGVSSSNSFQLSSGFMARGADCGTSIIPTYGYEMVQDVIAASGEVKTSGSFTLVSTFGEASASPCTASTSYQLSSGFWGGCQQQTEVPNFEVFLPVAIK